MPEPPVTIPLGSDGPAGAQGSMPPGGPAQPGSSRSDDARSDNPGLDDPRSDIPGSDNLRSNKTQSDRALPGRTGASIREDAEPEPADGLGQTVILPAQPAAAPAAVSAPPAAAAPATCGLPEPAGWFGKVPFLGDFASRRLPDAFIEPWDEWLQHGLATTQAGVGDGWLDLYLTFPVWRFVMPAGLVGDAAWIGVFLPSVDRVGRCFPLTICEPVARTTLERAGILGIDVHLGALAEAGIEALDASSVGFLEQRLASLGPMPAAATTTMTTPAPPIALEAWLRKSGPSPGDAIVGWPLHGSLTATSAAAASRFMLSALRERVLWWSPADDAGQGGALMLAPYPFSGSLLGNLIGTS